MFVEAVTPKTSWAPLMPRAMSQEREVEYPELRAFIDFIATHVSEIDAALRQHGLLTFSEVRRRYASYYRRILKRDRIKTTELLRRGCMEVPDHADGES